MRSRVAWGAVASEAVAVTAFLVAWSLSRLGNSASPDCDVYCGPQWAWLLMLMLWPLSMLSGLLSMILALAAITLTHARAVFPWVVAAVSLVGPALLVTLRLA
jgi:hypothetical protein